MTKFNRNIVDRGRSTFRCCRNV